MASAAEWSLMAVAKNEENGTKRVYKRKRKMCVCVCLSTFRRARETVGQVLERTGKLDKRVMQMNAVWG